MPKSALRLSLISLASLALVPCAQAQFLRGYIFAAAAPGSGAAPSNSSFGILPLPPVNAASASYTTFAAGGGLEPRFSRLLGAGLDLSAIVPGTGKVFGNTEGTVSPNLYVHWSQSDPRATTWDLYGTGGYTALFGSFSANGVNAGGGLNYWFRDRTGLAIEFRYIRAFSTNSTLAINYYQVRFGLTFR